MFDTILFMLACGVLYAIKGGSLAEIFTNYGYVRKKNEALDFLLDGKTLSTILFAVLIIVTQTPEPFELLCYAVAWILAVSPSIGEENGAVGDYAGGWGPYLTAVNPLKGEIQFGRSYGVKKAVQRGLVFGALFTLASASTVFLWACLLYVPCVFVGQCINRLILKQSGWTLAEPVIGAFVIGLPLSTI